ncbi:hypothetical protein [Cellulomonas sp. Leaf334]|uniref:hypothetical protein n=1 Tax=Cellulomonas sp. Leaf334 TaxID=1736339 RepID=UPI0006F956CC|nr:hypothetical protein [Cellulomonas sp. Leaf334]KQR17322.1 hypothetical protein ASF78_08530 [Cellulomonas sp. Leaf334]
MNSAPSTTPDLDIDTDEDESSWTDFFLPAVLFAIAVVPFTPLWDEIAQPDSTRRRYGGISRFLDSVGPLPVALAFAGLGLVILVGVLVQRSRKNAVAAPEVTED